MKKVRVMGGYYSVYKPVINELSTHTSSQFSLGYNVLILPDC